MKLAVESSVIHQIRLCDGISRVDLARRLQIAPSTIGIHVDRLVRGGYLREGAQAKAGSGRPRTLLELNPEAGQFIGVDLDAEQVRAISVDFAQQPLHSASQTLRKNATSADVLGHIRSLIAAVRRRSRPLLGIGVAVPGVIDLAGGTARNYRFIRDWDDVPVVDSVSERFGVPVFLENNIRAIALAERWFGQGRDVEDFLCLGIRSGIGSGVFVGGKLYRGTGNTAGEIGCWPVRKSTLEEAASTRAICDRVADAISNGKESIAKVRHGTVSTRQLLLAAQQSDALVCRLLREASAAVGSVVAQASMLLRPKRVIVAGPLATLETQFLEPLRSTFQSLSPEHLGQPAEVVASTLQEDVGALGAAGGAVQSWQPETPER